MDASHLRGPRAPLPTAELKQGARRTAILDGSAEAKQQLTRQAGLENIEVLLAE